MWKDSAGKYYWTLKSDENFKIIAKSSESYESFAGAKHGLEWTRANAHGASFEDHT